MASVPSLIVVASRSVWSRLRSDAGARALALAVDAAEEVGTVRWIPLSDADLETEAERSDEAWIARLRSIATTPQAPIVVLWVADAQGRAAAFRDAIQALGEKMLTLMQRDRVPPRVAGIVYIAEQGLDQSDAQVLEILSNGGQDLPQQGRELPMGLSVMIAKGRPVYLMSRRTRVGLSGASWCVADIWPIEVGRLLASMEASPSRQRGLRAWRSMRFNPTRYPYDQIELEAFRFAREAVGLPPDPDTQIVEGEGRQLAVARAPEALLSLDRAPQHCRDGIAHPGEQPVLPSWWGLASVAVRPLVDMRTDTSGSRLGRRSPWYERFDERGRLFIDDRAKLALQNLEESSGPRAVQTRAWQAIHQDPGLLAWYGSGQFYVGPRSDLDGVVDGLRAWSELNELERRMIASRMRALAQGEELDVARTHFVGLGWRFLCALAASLFIATVFSSIFVNAGWRWIVGISSAACGGAIIAAAIVLWLEIRAGNRGRGVVERTALSAESLISQGFLQRMRMGAEGERAGRQRRWFQAAARVRDAAARLKAIRDLAELVALRQASAISPSLRPELREYSAATSVEVADGLLSVELLRDTLRADGNDLIDVRSRAFDAWWAGALRLEDQLVTGAVRRRTFEPRVALAIAGIVDDFRQDLMSAMERSGASGDADWTSEIRFGEVLGSASDLRNLSVPTERASGRDLYRVVWVTCLLRRHAEVSAATFARQFGQGISAQAVTGAVDRWGTFGLMVDDIGVGFRCGPANVMCLDAISGVCIWEGADQGISYPRVQEEVVRT